MAKRSNPDFQNGVPELLILKLLEAREMYGYEIVKAIGESTGETLLYGEGSIYPVLHSLEAENQVKARRQEFGGRVRTYYKITAAGRKRLSAMTSDFESIVRAVRMVLGSGNATA